MRIPIPVAFDSRRTGRTVGAMVARGIEPYDRARHLPRILPVGPDHIADTSAAGRRAIVRRLARALRAERNRGRAGHWTYDLNRHIALAQAYAAERAALARITDA
ncbi:MAG: DUF6477 family protein [Bauldia sp.]